MHAGSGHKAVPAGTLPSATRQIFSRFSVLNGWNQSSSKSKTVIPGFSAFTAADQAKILEGIVG